MSSPAFKSTIQSIAIESKAFEKSIISSRGEKRREELNKFSNQLELWYGGAQRSGIEGILGEENVNLLRSYLSGMQKAIRELSQDPLFGEMDEKSLSLFFAIAAGEHANKQMPQLLERGKHGPAQSAKPAEKKALIARFPSLSAQSASTDHAALSSLTPRKAFAEGEIDNKKKPPFMRMVG